MKFNKFQKNEIKLKKLFYFVWNLSSASYFLEEKSVLIRRVICQEIQREIKIVKQFIKYMNRKTLLYYFPHPNHAVI